MRSSISSSKFIGISTLVFVALSVLYGVAIAVFAPSMAMVLPGQDQGQSNVILAEHWLYSGKRWPTVLVGSSLGARLVPEILPEGMYNLAFAGGTSATGIELILRSGELPRTVVVEVNNLREPDLNLLRTVFHPLNSRIRRWVAASRDEFQPITLLDAFAQRGKPGAQEYRMNPQILNEAIAQELRVFQTVDPEQLARSRAAIEKLGQGVDRLRERGVRVLLLKFPVDPRLAKSQALLAEQKLVSERFNASHYGWISLPEDRTYETSDGLHLTGTGAREFLGVLLRYL